MLRNSVQPVGWSSFVLYCIVIIEHPRSGGGYNFGRFCQSVCLSVSLSDDNFRRPSRRKFIFAHPVYLQAIRVKFVYECHRVKVKVTGAENVQNANVNFSRP